MLLVDLTPVGSGQTLARGALYSVIETMGLHDSLRQVHLTIVLHAPHHELTYHQPYPFCTFDYADFCTLLTERAGTDYVQASLFGYGWGRRYDLSGRLPRPLCYSCQRLAGL